jgi:zinc protease
VCSSDLWLTPPAYTPDAYSASTAVFALGGAKASRLDQALVIKAQIAQSVTCEVTALKLTGIASCDITAKPGVKLEDLEAAFWKELGKLQQDGPTAEEVKASKALKLTSKISGLQRLGGFGGVADTLDEYNQYTGDPGFLPKDVAMTEAVTVASTKAAADKFLSKDSAVVVYCVPGKKVLQDVPRSPADTDANVKIVNPYTPEFEKSQEWRKNKPAAGPASAIHLPVPAEFTLDNGLKVLVVEEHALPLLTAELVSRAGSENNKPATSKTRKASAPTSPPPPAWIRAPSAWTCSPRTPAAAWSCSPMSRCIPPSAPPTWNAAASSASSSSRRRPITSSGWPCASVPSYSSATSLTAWPATAPSRA